MATRLFIKDASVKFVIPPGPYSGAVEYNCDVNTIEVLSKPGDDVKYATLCPNGTVVQKGASTYEVHIKGVQDWNTGGLSLFLWTNAGSVARCVVNANGASAAFATATPGFDTTVTVVEGAYGGEANKWAEFEVTLPCTTRPTLVTSTPTGTFQEGVEPSENEGEAPVPTKTKAA